jgi:glycerol-3-phosphate acyltransferase PlsY
MQRQHLSTIGITLPLLTITAIVEVFNPSINLFLKVIFLVVYAMVLIVGVFALFRSRSNLKRLDQRRERALQGDIGTH